MNQADKYHLSLAGEYFVAAELQRRGVQASITYGNAKKTDVVAFVKSANRAIAVEVKSTGQNSWIVGGSVPKPNEDPWVFVHISSDRSAPPRYFILTQAELNAILAPIDEDYQKKYRQKHGHDFKNNGVVTLSLKNAEPYADKWATILSKLVTP